MARARVILVDDEPDLIDAFAEYLTDRGFEIVVAYSSDAFDEAVEAGLPDLIVLDLAMPGEGGRSVLERVRRSSDVPVIIMTGSGGLLDRVLSLEMGADDVVSKPVEPRELAARIETLIARRRGRPSDLVKLEAVTVDLRAARVMHNDGHEERLGIGEIMLFRAFVDNPHRLMTRDALLDLAPAVDRDALDRAIDPRVSRLKKKLVTEWIETRRGQGYVYAPPVGPEVKGSASS